MNTNVTSFQTVGNLSIVQFNTPFMNSFNYISSGKAIESNLIEVKEINDSGSVNQLLAFNNSSFYVFFMDGDILAGAKQNRVLNTSVLLAPNSKTVIPVSCVERGRWSKVSNNFDKTDYTAPTIIRASKASKVRKCLDEENLYMADQGEIWENVSSSMKFCKLESKTENLSDLYEAEEKKIRASIDQIKLTENSNGISVFHGSTLLNVDIFNRNDIFTEYFPKILKGAAVDVLLSNKKSEITEAEACYKTQTFLDETEKLEFIIKDGVGVGKEKRFESEELTGFELDYNTHPIHFTILNLKSEIK